MSDKSTFNMILKGDEGLSPPAGISMIHPDPKGPKTVAIFLLFGGILLAIFAYEDLVYSQLDDFTDAEVLAIIETPNSQGDNISVEDFQLYHDEAFYLLLTEFLPNFSLLTLLLFLLPQELLQDICSHFLRF